jgi:hypothetical protein
MTYLQSFSITRPIMPITMLASFAKLDTRADNPAKATVSVAVRCRMALTDSPVSALARRFGNAFDRLVIRCFPPPVESEGEWRLPQWPHCPRWPHLPWNPHHSISTPGSRLGSSSDSAPESRPGSLSNSASGQRPLARPVGSIAISRISSTSGTSTSGLMGTLLVIPEVKS